MKKIKCEYCGNLCDINQKFCSECGGPLQKTEGSIPLFVQTETIETTAVNIYPEDKGLKLIVDYIEKTGPLVTGESYSEIVLYLDEKKDSYQIHTYNKYGSSFQAHAGYLIDKQTADNIIDSIDEDIFKKNTHAIPMMGGSRVFKFLAKNGEIIRKECLTKEDNQASSNVVSKMYQTICQENRIVPEYAKTWKSCMVVSSSMNMDNCYQYTIERSDDLVARVKGYCFLEGVRKEISDWLVLNEEENNELKNIPLGLMISNKEEPNPMNNGLALMAFDGESTSFCITYEDDKKDTKIPDKDMLRSLNELMKNVIKKGL